MVNKSSPFLPLSLCLLFLPLSSILWADKTPGVGYSPPPDAIVFHCDTSNENLKSRCGGSTTRLNVNVPWSGSNGDVTGYVGRYLGGRLECAASWICGVGNENECLNSAQKLREMFQRGELGDRNLYTGEPTRRECHDFGAQHPGLGSVGRGTNRLRKQPIEPPGCCRKSLPCVVDEPGRIPGEIWQEPVETVQGGRKGCFLLQGARVPDPDPSPGPDPGPDPDPASAPAPPVRCYILKVDSGLPTILKEISCPIEIPG